jgi:hypothetical protein
MKKTILIGLIVLMTSCTSKYKYLITDHKGQYYLCNFYNKTGDGCILFNDKPGYNNKETGFPTRLCGNYEIKSLR